MRRIGAVLFAIVVSAAAHAASRNLEIYFIDVEGGQSTLIVTPAGESLLIDAGYGRGSLRDPERILAAAKEAHIDRIDYFLATHFHGDHVGGVPELAKRIPIGTYIDYGSPLGTIYGGDPASRRPFEAYAETRGQHPHIVPRPGDRLPLEGLRVDVVSSSGTVLTAPLSVPLPGAGELNEACGTLEDHPEDGTENFRSVGIVLRYGSFSFVNLGDLSGNTLSKIICPRNLLGEASMYLISHHGDYDTDSRAMYVALKPRVAIMNNGAFKGGDPAVFWTARTQPNLDLWQLHTSQFPGARNAPNEFIANLGNHERDETGYWIRVIANEDGSFTVANGRTGFARIYSPNSSFQTH